LALVFAQGRLTSLRQAWQEHRILPLVSRVTAAELIRVLAYPKFKLLPEEQKELLADYLPYCKTVQIPPLPQKTPACRDAFDVPFLQLALAGKAKALLTCDRDLLDLGSSFACPSSAPKSSSRPSPHDYRRYCREHRQAAMTNLVVAIS
jgi:putative PIN family toxin of toxin-antitoxin system